jgi:hypothetical protein
MFRLGLLTLTLSAAAFAQTVPGTFTALPPQTSNASTLPLVSTPTMTLSNGFSPATVTLPQTITAEQPQSVAQSGMPQSDEAFTGSPSAKEPASGDFNFASVNPQSAFSFGMASRSLGEIAREFKAGHVEAHKTYTNEDIERLTSEAPENGIIYAKLGNGQPIVDRNQSGFSPMSGIANMPEVTNDTDRTELANGRDANADQGENDTTASDVDQGQSVGQRATTPSMDATRPANNNDTQQLPASDNPR